MNEKLTPSYLIKELGWELNNGQYTKTKYPFALKWNDKTGKFEVVDRYFHGFENDSPKVFIETKDDYIKVTDSAVHATQNANETEVHRFKILNLVKSFSSVVKTVLSNIQNWDAVIKENQIKLFIEQSFRTHAPILRVDDLEAFFEKNIKNNPQNNLDHLRTRLREAANGEIRQTLNEIIQITKQAISEIDRETKPFSHH